MTDLSKFDVNAVANRNNNIFGLPFSEEDAQVIILPVPWEVTVSCNAGTSRAVEHIFKTSTQIDLFDPNMPHAWKKGFYMRQPDKEINEGSVMLNNWVYEQTKDLLKRDKLVCLLGGDHSISLGYFKALAEKYE